MKQQNKIILETILKQQERLMKRLYEEKDALQNALFDKEEQIILQNKVLERIKNKIIPKE